ncbi:MAG: fatty acid oxidation complex subunit alpha FadB [Pseudomonadales bacterium]|nr:fatty acid oxidation complex subunit alpha FadB [Pseudomonadales bacterium]MCP5214726.1 fatty acid oxidation complex subunit alpha FadB [Pseudomonadales bacterium]
MIFQGNTIQVEKTDQGFAELVLDAKESKVNILNTGALQELRAAVDAIKSQGDIKGLLISSAKDSFILGADINEFLTKFALPHEELLANLNFTHSIFNDIEDLPYATVTAINGEALGGGFELALSTDFRVIADNAKVGLPEVNLGIIPGFGGCVRLSRLIGAENALEWITSGKSQSANAALQVGVADSVVNAALLRESALDLLQQCHAGKLDQLSNRQAKKSPLTLRPIEGTMAFESAKGMIMKLAGPHYPAPFAAIEAIEKSAHMARAEALQVEAATLIQVAKTDVCKALVGLFLNSQALKKIAGTALQLAKPVKQSAVLGAGIMGGGIAYQSALKGIPVVMRDIADKALDLGISEATKQLNKSVEKGRLKPAEMAKILGSIKPTLEMSDIKTVDVVVEAVVENPKIKLAVLEEVENTVGEGAIITSNTSTISIDYLATALKNPERFCGMHFFNPVPLMPLVEIIRGEKTSDETIATVVAYATAIGKTPIVVNDCPGFLVNRVLFPYFLGFNLLIRDGADFRQVDKIMERFGWPMGPAYLQDVVGIDTCHHCIDVMEEGFPERMKFAETSILDLLYEASRYGQKNGKGFYHYEPDAKGRPAKTFNEDILGFIGKIQPQTKEFSQEEVIARLMVPMCLEVARCLEEGIVASAAEADMALIMGLGFPKFRGGALRYIDTIGADKFCALADQYAALGKLYEVPKGLRLMSQNGSKYF